MNQNFRFNLDVVYQLKQNKLSPYGVVSLKTTSSYEKELDKVETLLVNSDMKEAKGVLEKIMVK